MNYKSINYSEWNFDGNGKNILKFLSHIEKNIWEKALQFQDTREGEKGHAEFVAYFSLKLLDFFPKADREVIIPTAILHDIGWSQLTKSEHRLFYETEIDSASGLEIWQCYEPILRARHQEQGVLLAEKILKEVNYPPKETGEILEIISQHDTRKGFLNINEGIVRDADKLWRYTIPCFDLWTEKRHKSLKETYEFLVDEAKKEGFFYSEISREIERIELENVENCYKTK